MSGGTLGVQIAGMLEQLTLEKVSAIGFINAQANRPHISLGRSVAELRQSPLVRGESALVIAAGPSLHRRDVATIIKTANYKGTIITTDSALSWCLRNGIVPHLVVTLDPHASRIVRWFGDPELSEAALPQDDYFVRQDMDPAFRQNQLRVNAEIVRLINAYGSQIRVAIASSASQAVVKRVLDSEMTAYWWNPMYDDYECKESLTRKIHNMNGLPCVNAGGNVGSACWVFAHAVLGKRRVGLVGMDFGYYEDTPYSQTQYYREIISIVGPDQLDEVFVRIRNPYSQKEFYTDPTYLWYRDSFLEVAQQAECETYNCTDGGILFGPGVRWLSLQEFLTGWPV